MSILRAIGSWLRGLLVKWLLGSYLKKTNENTEKLASENKEKTGELEKRAENLIDRIDKFESGKPDSNGNGDVP